MSFDVWLAIQVMSSLCRGTLSSCRFIIERVNFERYGFGKDRCSNSSSFKWSSSSDDNGLNWSWLSYVMGISFLYRNRWLVFVDFLRNCSSCSMALYIFSDIYLQKEIFSTRYTYLPFVLSISLQPFQLSRSKSSVISEHRWLNFRDTRNREGEAWKCPPKPNVRYGH